MPTVTNLSGTKMVKLPAGYKKIKWDKPSCSQFQTNVKAFLKPLWQLKIGVCEEFIIPASKLRVDILCFSNKIAIETSGAQHFEYNKFFHGGNQANFLASIKRDDRKRVWLEKNGFSVVELVESDVAKLSVQYIIEKFGVDIS